MIYLKNDITDEIGYFGNYQPGWSPASAEDPPVPQPEIDAWLLTNAKIIKLQVLKADKTAFCDVGLLYSGDTFCLSDISTSNIILKNTLPAGATDRYKYYDITDVQRDFTDAAGWDAFFDTIIPEKDWIMRYYCATKKEINDAADMTALDAIIIDFSA